MFHFNMSHGVVLKYLYHLSEPHNKTPTSFFRMLFLGLMCRRARALKQKWSDPAPGKVPADPLPGCKVDVDVDEDHDAGGDVERAQGGVQNITRLGAQLKQHREDERRWWLWTISKYYAFTTYF